MGDSTGIQLYFQKASAMFNANEGNNDDVVMLNSLEISESWQELDDSTFVHDTNTEDHYHLSTIHQAIYFTEEYLSTVAERGEDIKKLLATMKLLFSFRRALHGKADLDGEKMVELVEEAKTRIANKEISGDHGLYEIKAYIKATEKAIVIKQGLIATLHNNQVCGYLNELYLDGVDYVDLERWITKARNFLITGRDMTIGLSTLVDQAKVLFKLRKGVKNNNWLQIDKILSSGLQKLSEWRYIKTELLHIEKAFQYRSFYVNMNQILSEFTILTTKEQSSTPVTLGGKQEYKTINSKNDLEYNFYSYKVDLQQFNDLFAIFDGIAQYSSDLLPPNAQCSLSNRFFTETKFSACKATWRLLRAVVNQNWYQKKSIYSEPSQKIDINVDLLIYDFFGLDDADYVDNGYLWEQHVIKNNKNNNLVIQEAFAPLNHNETVFSVLISTNWSFFSQNLWNFYRRARNSLIDIYVRTDLKYYCLHGGTSIDKAGNYCYY